MEHTTTPKRSSPPEKGGYTSGIFHKVKSVADFAKILDVNEKAIKLIVPTNDACAKKDCPFNAIAANRGYCVLHSTSWRPKPDGRGSAMYGPSFMRQSNPNAKRCYCDLPTCKEAGYFPSQGAFQIPQRMWPTVFSAGSLFISEKVDQYINNPNKVMQLGIWHFYPEHLVKTDDNKWALPKYDATKKYKDRDKSSKAHDFPPPTMNPHTFIEEQLSTYVPRQERWTEENPTSKMPTWMLNMLDIDEELFDAGPSPLKKKMTEQANNARSLQMKLELLRARAKYYSDQAEALQQSSRDQLIATEERHKEELSEAKKQYKDEIAAVKKQYENKISVVTQQYEGSLKKKDDEISKANTVIEEQEEEIAKLKAMIKELEEENKQAQLLLEERERIGRPLRYEDLSEEGLLGKYVRDFTFFNTKEQNDLFLDVMNFADGTEGSYEEGDGLLENMRPYSNISREERAGDKSPPSMDMNSPEYETHIKKAKELRQQNGRTWKDDYLAYSIYLRSGATQRFVACLCGISPSKMSNILYGWTQVLDDGLQRMFPPPTRSQVLRAYPDRFREADGHVMCFMILDAVEFFAQSSSNPNVSSTTFSDYKNHSTVKFLAGCGVLGEVFGESVPDGNGGRGSDVMMTDHTNILVLVPFGWYGKMDKGFTVEDIAAREGARVDRPQKRLRNQKQQSAADTAQTQKVGNTRIIIENVNGGVKMDMRYLNALIPCNQYGIISQIVRVGFLLQNFKKAFIQNRNPDIGVDGDTDNEQGRPCRAEIRWYGTTDAGLTDYRGSVGLWGLKCEKDRFAKLQQMEEHKDKSEIDIGEMVLQERWDLKKREELYALDGREYTGEKFNQELYEFHGVN